jgi:methionine-rich copper-binding protein CopC
LLLVSAFVFYQAVTCLGIASAHATLRQSVPADRAQLAQAPDHVDLYFTEHLVQNRSGTFAIVLNGMGRQVSGEASIDPRDGTHLVVPVQGTLDAGTYVVFWKTTSDDDGGVSLGNFSFSVGQSQQPDQTGAVSGQVLVPDDQRTRALSAPAPSTDSGSARGVVLGIVGGVALGATVASLLLTVRHRRAAGRSLAVRRRRG